MTGPADVFGDGLRGPVLVTGTDAGVGKTVVTAAVAAAAATAGLTVAVLKLAELTDAAAPSTVDTIARLAGPGTTRTLGSFPGPLAPLAAARVAGITPLELYAVIDEVRAEVARHDLVLLQGTGGLLVPMGLRPSGQAWTVADLAVGLDAPSIVVAHPGSGTVNHTALTLEALDRRSVPATVVIGAWPEQPDLIHVENLVALYEHLAGAVPAGAGALEAGVFRRSTAGWLTPRLFGELEDVRSLVEDDA